MAFLEQKEFTIITKHYVMIFIGVIKLIFFIFLSLILYYIAVKYRNIFGEDIVKIIFFPLIFVIINYAFFRIILQFIFYYNNLIIILKDKIIILKSSLVIRDDTEIISLWKVTKIDVYKNGFFKNILDYGNLVIEMQRSEVKTIHFLPKPHKAIQIIRDKTIYGSILSRGIVAGSEEKNLESLKID
ncbi:hypothetical protein KAZ01_01195 [Candidatus Gracilibacteria bacterium]|nr:hypothetical protein [Candidatus Gracilibacteria bacterium]